jgi:hypothetical protein
MILTRKITFFENIKLAQIKCPVQCAGACAVHSWITSLELSHDRRSVAISASKLSTACMSLAACLPRVRVMSCLGVHDLTRAIGCPCMHAPSGRLIVYLAWLAIWSLFKARIVYVLLDQTHLSKLFYFLLSSRKAFLFYMIKGDHNQVRCRRPATFAVTSQPYKLRKWFAHTYCHALSKLHKPATLEANITQTSDSNYSRCNLLHGAVIW